MTSLVRIYPNSPQYPGMDRGFNQRWVGYNLQTVYLPHDSNQVRQALKEAQAAYPGQISIKSGGHCYENFVFNDRIKAVIDLSSMNAIGRAEIPWDPARCDEKAYFLDAGIELLNAGKYLYSNYAKCLPCGSCYAVAAGGHICGGGYGLLSRLYGLVVDHLSAIEVVVMKDPDNPARVYAAKDSDDAHLRDLFWASCGGGGGNFGVITRYYFADLPPAPKYANLTTIAIDWSEIQTLDLFQDILSLYAGYCATWSDEIFALGAFKHISGQQVSFMIQAVYNDDTQGVALQAEVDAFQNALKALVPTCKMTVPFGGHLYFHPTESIQRLPWIDAVETLAGIGPVERGKYKSAYMLPTSCQQEGETQYYFDRDQSAAMFEWLTMPVDEVKSRLGITTSTRLDLSSSLIQIDSYGGKINTIEPAETAIPQRSSSMKLQYQTYWKNNLGEAEGNRQREQFYLGWIRHLYQDVYHNSNGVPEFNQITEGCYYNYPDVDLGTGAELPEALYLYFKDNLDRLQQVKAHWDPQDIFQSAQSIPPA